MDPFFFGTGTRPIFGVYHEASGASRGHGVILAYPGSHEYTYSHYAFRMLAMQLAKSGFSVLRFDWSGTGDSGGESSEASFATWRQDLKAAEQELRDLAVPARISVVAFRLGGAIAASTRFSVGLDRLVLWEPVLNGSTYLQELRAIEKYKLAGELNPPDWWDMGSPSELLGTVLTAEQRSEIASFELAELDPHANQVDIVIDAATPAHRALVGNLEVWGKSATIHETGRQGGRRAGVLLSSAVISRIVGILGAG